MKKQGFLNSRKFKYGSVAMILTIMFIAAILIFNVIFTALSTRYRWYVDMTKEQLYGITDASRVLLDEVKEVQVKFIFLSPFDQLDKGNLYTKLPLNCAQEYAKEYKNITIEYIDMIQNPTAVNKYKTTAGTQLKTTDVIIETNLGFRKYALDALYTKAQSDNSIFAFNAEKKYTSAILQLCGTNNPIAYFTGETPPPTFTEMFVDAGYDVRSIDLTTEEIDPAAQVFVIYDPRTDIQGISDETAGKLSGIEKLDKFLDNFGSLMVFLSPTTPKLPVLDEFMNEWGVSYAPAVIQDTKNTISTDGYYLIADYPTEGLGASLHKDLRELSTVPKTIVPYSMPLKALWTDKDGRNLSPVLTSSKGSVAYEENKDQAFGQGPFNLMTLTRETQYIDNEPKYSYVLVSGSTAVVNAAVLQQKAYGNSDIFFALMREMGKERVPIDIDFKVFEDNALDIAKPEANAWTIAFTVVIPLLVFAVGIVVWYRRKHL